MPSHAATAHVGLANWGATLKKTAENWTKFTRGKSQKLRSFLPSAKVCVCAPGSGPASQAQRAPRVISDCDVRPLLDDKPCWKMPIESFPIEEPVSALNGSPNSIEALRAPEIKLILRAFSVDPVLILDAKTKMDLVELARHHGITCVPDEWTLQKLKSKECGVEEALSQQQHYDGFEHPKSAGFTQPAPVEEEEEEDEESLVVSTGRGGAQAKKKKKTTKKKARSPRSPKSASQAEGAKKALRSAERKTAQQGLEASPESFHSTEEISLGGGSSGGGSSGSQEVPEMRVYRMVPHYNGPAPREVALSWARGHVGDATAELGEHLDPRSAFVVHLPPRSAAAVPGAHSLMPNGSRAAATAGAHIASAAEAEAEAEPNATAEDPLAAYRGQCVVLYTTYASNMLFEVAWRKLETQFQGMGLKYTAIDGAAPEAKAVRSLLWAISNDRSYPQVFACRHGGACEFLGGASEMQALFDSGEHARRLAEYLELPSEIPQGGGPIREVGGVGSGLVSSNAGACFVWVGAQSCDAYRQAALRWAALLERFEGAPPAHEEEQGRESEPFWRAVSCGHAVPGHAFVAVRKATPLAAYDAEYGPGIATFLPKPVPVLSLSPAEGAPSQAEGTLVRDAATGDIVGPQQRWHAALNALLFVHHLSSY